MKTLDLVAPVIGFAMNAVLIGVWLFINYL
jgi:hypothetical protein